MAENTIFTDEELEKMLANFEWNSDEESSEVDEYSDVVPRTINTKFLWPEKPEDDPYFHKKPAEEQDTHDISVVHAILANIQDDSGAADTPDGWKVPKRTSFVEVTSLRDQRISLVPSLASTVASSRTSEHPQEDDDEINIGGDASTPGEKFSGATAPLGVVYDEGAISQARHKQYHIAMELLTTERTYVRGLHILEKVLHGALKTALKSHRPILSEKSMKDVVLNVAEIYALSYDLLRELEKRMEEWDTKPTVADILIKRGPYFKLYSMYSSNFELAQMEYSKLLRKNKAFRELVQLIETSPVCMGMPLSSYMLLPIQRIPRYRLLLLDYLEHLPPGAPDMQNAEIALKTVSIAADHMNTRIKQLENQARIIRIQKSFAGKESIVESGRYYVGRGPVLMVTGGPGRLKFRQCVLFLFSDLLLVTMVTATGSYKIKQKLSLIDMKVSKVDYQVYESGFMVVVPNVSKAFRFQAQSEEERDLWTKKLQSVISDACNHRQTYFYEDFYEQNIPKFHPDPEIKTAIEVLSEDPSIEVRESNWLRRSFRRSVRRLRKTPNSPELPKEDDIDDPTTDMTTEFVPEDHQDGPQLETMLIPCLDNRLSAYLNQKSIYRDVWRRRWFILTNWLLVCFEDHTRVEPTGALPLSGYHISLPDVADGISRPLVFKLSHPTKRPYYFQLLSEYEFNKWFKMLQELCASDAMKLSTLV
ncbi:FYVE, RhoGEF and PH domain-containing protein 6-like [Dysidea avara]|uniref:FYVE, RhoGEF and PH domain-containing protein 6-like n=1 Tax=Dysidea avara TaxID=196820 RepID=UPI00331665C6